MNVIARYHEIALKGRNRPFFVEKLADNLRQALSDLPGVTVQPFSSRIGVHVPDETPWETVHERVGRVFGVANFSRAREVPADLEALKRAAATELRGASFASFRVTTRRADKTFPFNSGQIDREIGAAVQAATGVRVDLEEPELTLWVEVLRDRILYSFERLPGPGGFPVGSSGRVLALLSGGIDSPVAAWRMMKRGCRVVLAHFHAFPLQDRSTIDKTRELARILTRWQLRTRLLQIPFGPVQQAVVAACPAPLRVVLYRRFMMRIAEALARRRRARALVTGESLGQVASQTLDNMVVIGEATRATVLRPLVGMDKEEITAQARRIGTFEVSTRPDQDCCQLFVPRHPATAASREEVERAETALDVPALVAAALEGVAEERFEFPPLASSPP
ncbi:MAG: tRNA 4-thiouridine(8) synthase ThiI [Acidobacteria bacterium]|nr:MAG: tRNA 4-thiouridine(8) synthase ThiI [Acidobacteriota bacterium]